MAQTADSTSSTEASAEELEREPTGAPDGVSSGRVVGAHGLLGELRIRATADELMNLLSVQSVRLTHDKGGARPGEYQVERARQGRVGECRLALRGVGDMRTPMLIFMAINGVNILASCVLVYVFQMGVNGIVYGTIISRGVGAVIMLTLLVRGCSGLILIRSQLSVVWPRAWRILRIGIPLIA